MSPASPKPLHLDYGALVPLPPDEAFAFVCDPLNWPAFFSSLEGTSRDDDWARVGSRGSMSNVVLGRTITSQIEVTVWDPPREFRYLSRQEGTPALDNRRVFEPCEGGTRLRGTTDVVPRSGVGGLVDRLRLKAIARLFAGAMTRLPDAALEPHHPGPPRA